MLKFPKTVTHVLISNLLRSTRTSHFSRAISSTSWNSFAGGVGPMDRLFMKPILLEEDSTDDEYDENMNLKKSKNNKKGIGHGLLDEADDEEMGDSDFDDDQQPLPQKRVGREILKLGRVNYRVPEVLPDWIMQRKEQISEHRTTKQLRRCIKNWMLKPDREIQKKYSEKEIGWSNTAPREAMKEASRVMSYGPEETVAYVNFFMPSRYVITRRVFNELKEFLPKYRPRRIYDFGCGPATCAAAAVDVWGQDTIERYVGVDMSQSMLDAAKIMTTRMGLVIPSSPPTPSSSPNLKRGAAGQSGPDVIFTTKSADVIGRIASAKDDSQRFDMAIAAYTLSELTSDSVKRAAVQVLFESLDNNGLLVIIDNGSPIGSHHTRSARQMLLDLFGNKDNLPQSDSHKAQAPSKDIEIKYVLKPPGAPRFSYEDYEISVISPCTHDGTCPLRPGSWCSFPQRAQSSLIRKQNEEKFSYVVLQKKLKLSSLLNTNGDSGVTKTDLLMNNSEDYWLTHVTDPRLVSADPTPLNIVQRFLDYDSRDTNPLAEQLMEEVDFDDYHPPLVRSEYGRILRSPMKKKEHVVMDLCQADGYLTRTTISKSSAWNIPHFYSAIRKLRWGGIVPALPVSVQDLSAHEEKSNSTSSNSSSRSTDADGGGAMTETGTGYQPILVMSPLARRRPSTYPPVRRDVTPPTKVEKNLFRHGEGPQGRYERNRDAKNSGIELYQHTSDGAEEEGRYGEMDLPKDLKEDEELNEMFANEQEDFERMAKYSKTIDALRRNEKLIGKELGGLGDEDEDDEIMSADENEEDRELLEGYDDSDSEGDDDDVEMTEEDKKRMISMTDEDWQEWLDILEGKDPALKAKKKERNEEEEGGDFLPSLGEKKKRRSTLSLSDSSSSSQESRAPKARKGSSMNEALLSKLSSKSGSSLRPSSVIEKPSSPSAPSSGSSSGGRKKPTPFVRRSKKTD